MNSRDNLQTTLNHQQPDKMVIDFGSTAITGIHVLALKNLRKYYGFKNVPIKVIEPFQMLGEVDKELCEVMGVDIVGAYGKENMFGFANSECEWKHFTAPWGQELMVPVDFNFCKDAERGLLMFPEGDMSVPPSARMPNSGYFFDAINRQEPIDEGKLNPEDNLEEFGHITDETLAYWKRTIDKLSGTGKGIIASFGGTGLGDVALVSGMQLKRPKGIRDVTEWYMSTIMRPDYIHSIFEKQTEIAIENFSKIFQVVGSKIDAVFICGTDFGTQNSTFCSPEQFKELYYPYYKRINDWIHENTSWKSFKHCCGAIETFMSLFIEAGFDIINPVQINAEGMDPTHLKNTYGKDLVFWGGGVDTQKILPFGTPDEVKRQVWENCEIFAKDGGFVFNTVHNVQANVPIANIVAMMDAVKEFNG